MLAKRVLFSGNGWRELGTRPKRPLNSIILDPGIIDLVIEDVQDFLDSKEWYADRGIPFRRGYLLVRLSPSRIQFDAHTALVWCSRIWKNIPHS